VSRGALDLRILLDIVPNHMSASQYNPWWMSSETWTLQRFAEFFDIGNPRRRRLRCIYAARETLWRAMEAGELSIEIVQGSPRLRHYENTWPLGPASWGELALAAGEALLQ